MYSVTMDLVDDRASVIALSPRAWRVSDPAKVEEDGLALIGFVERNNDLYEATALRSPRSRTVFPSLEDAINALVRGATCDAAP